jgi:signal transduction histidine kinase
VINRFSKLQNILEKASGAGELFADDALKELSRLQGHTSQRDEHSRLAALYRVSRALGSTLDLDDVLRESMDAVIELTGAERGCLMLLKIGTDELELQAGRNFRHENLDKDEMEFSRAVIETVMSSGEGVLTTNAQTDERFSARDSVSRYALRSIMCQPLLVRGLSIGVIYVDNKVKAGIFSEADLELLEAFATQAAVAIDNAILFTQTDAALARRVIELETLHEIDRQLNARLDFDRVLEITLDWAQKGTAADSGWIAMIKEDEPVLILSTNKDQTLDQSLDTSLLGSSLFEGPALHLHPPESNADLLIVPARREGTTLALIGVLREQGTFEQEAEDFLLRLAERAAVAIENTQLYLSAQQADESKSQFITIVTHELKIPMTSIRGYADLIRQGTVGPVTDGQLQFLDTIRNNVDRMAELVSDLSDISRIDTGRLKVDLEPTSISDYLRETVANLRPQFEGKGQQVNIKHEKNLPRVIADRARLIQILTNLLSNANKYTPEGGSITISATHKGDALRVHIQDTGIGLSEAEQEQLFSQFFRSEQPQAREQVGWGLGLYVTRRLLELMGGEIGVESSLGQGSTFWFSLPIATASEM